MRVIGLLSWFDESPAWLAACVTSAARICDHIVCVDGAYRHYPGGKGSSGVEQSEALRLAAEAAGVGITLHVPRDTWNGDEVGKRDFLFRAGHLTANPDVDWFFVIDADELVTECDRYAVRSQLTNTDLHVARVMYHTHTDHAARGDHLSHLERHGAHEARRFFRAPYEPIRVAGQHWMYLATRDGHEEILWGIGEVPAVEIDGLHMEHRTHLRPPTRRTSQDTYYRIRDTARLEAAPARLKVPA